MVMDPLTLGEHHRVVIDPGARPFAVSRRFAVFGNPLAYLGKGQASPTLCVLRRSDGVEVARVEVPLQNEMILGAAVDDATLFVGISGIDNDAFLAGAVGSWYRVEAYPLGSEGVRWSYRSDGYLASNPILEKGRLTLAAVPGPLPQPKLSENKAWFAGFAAPLKLALVRVDARSGALLGTEPFTRKSASPPLKDLHPASVADSTDPRILLLPQGGIGQYTDPISPRVLFPGGEESVWGDPSALLEYLFPPAGTPPLELEPGSLERNIYLDILGRFVVRDGTVYEAFGQGLLLVKDYGDGAWMAPFAQR